MPSKVGNSLSVSRLYHLEPIGLGTPYVESLTSYIARLAEAHCVTTGTLVAKEIIPLINKEYMIKGATQGGSMFYYSSAAINGVGSLSLDFLNALRELTLSEDILYTTMQNWRDVLSPRELFHSRRAWCPLCLREWREKEKVIYEPLIWYFKAVTKCPVHLTDLVLICSHDSCNKPNLFLNRKSRPGYCSQCGEWLGVSPPTTNNEVYRVSDDRLSWIKWSSDNMGELVAIAPKLSFFPLKERVFANINTLVAGQKSGNVAAFSNIIGVSKSSLSQWCSGSNIPSINSLLRLCYHGGARLVDLITKDEIFPATPELDSPSTERNYHNQARRVFNHQLVERQLEEIIVSGETPPPSISEVARRFRCGRRTIQKYFPELAKAVSERYRTYIKNERDKRIEVACDNVRRGSEKLVESEIYPSRRRVEELLDPKWSLREDCLKRAWKNILSKYNL